MLDFLSNHPAPQRPLAISQACGYTTKKSINPTLYDLLQEGLIEKVLSKPLTWKLAGRDHLITDNYFDSVNFRQSPSPGSRCTSDDSGPKETSHKINGTADFIRSENKSINMQSFPNNRFNPNHARHGQGLQRPGGAGHSGYFQGPRFPNHFMDMNGRGNAYNGPGSFIGAGYGMDVYHMGHASMSYLPQPLGRARHLCNASYRPEVWRSTRGQKPRSRGVSRGRNRGKRNHSSPGQAFNVVSTKDVDNKSYPPGAFNDRGNNPSGDDKKSASKQEAAANPEARNQQDSFRKSLHDKTAPGAYVPKRKTDMVGSLSEL